MLNLYSNYNIFLKIKRSQWVFFLIIFKVDNAQKKNLTRIKVNFFVLYVKNNQIFGLTLRKPLVKAGLTIFYFERFEFFFGKNFVDILIRTIVQVSKFGKIEVEISPLCFYQMFFRSRRDLFRLFFFILLNLIPKLFLKNL